MRFILILVWLSVSAAQDDDIATTNWLLQVLNNQETGEHQETSPHQDTGNHQDTNKHQDTSNHLDTDKHPSTDKPKELGNRFNPSQIQTPLVPDLCTLSNGDDGLCVNPLYCAKKPEPTDPTTRFMFREVMCPITLICCPINSVKDIPDPPKTLPTVCGVSNPGGHNFRISNPKSDFSKFAEFPWMVALLTPQHSSPWKEKEYIGGGSLIHPSVVLTVAHKLDKLSPSQIICRAGEWDTTNDIEILPHQDRNVREIVLHNNFERAHARYDAALLFLESPFDLEGVYHIGLACLAPDLPVPGTICYSMGWGKTLKDTYATTLKKAEDTVALFLIPKLQGLALGDVIDVCPDGSFAERDLLVPEPARLSPLKCVLTGFQIQLPLVDDATCTSQLRRTELGPTFDLHSTLLCAGGEEGVDTCTGDGGSSLVCSLPSYKSLKRFAVYGMVVYGMGCGLRDVPGVYAKVPSVYDWVNRKMEEHQLTKTYVI